MLYPDKITIFRTSIEEYASTPDELEELVRDTVWHEIAHHFGYDEDGIVELEEKRHNHHAKPDSPPDA